MATLADLKNRTPHDVILIGNNFSYMTLAYFPVKALKKFLPAGMSLPSEQLLAEKFPTVQKVDGMHPFMLQFANCNHVHDIMTNIELRTYEEITVFFPVIYTHNGEQQLCSLVQLMYLDFLIGVMGGLYFGIRKQFRPSMKTHITETSKTYSIKNVLQADFQQKSNNTHDALEPFFAQMFEQPAVTYSYFKNIRFYRQKVFNVAMIETSVQFEWLYKGSVIRNTDNGFSNYATYDFSVSQAMSYQQYFHPPYSLDGR
jgi:hypothetical protein